MKKGFTLIEVIVASALFVLVVALVSAAFGVQGRINARVEHQLNVQQVGVSVVEGIRHYATKSEDRAALLENIQDETLFRGCVVSALDEWRCTHETMQIILKFSNEDRYVRVHVTRDSGEVFEVMEWLSYGGS